MPTIAQVDQNVKAARRTDAPHLCLHLAAEVPSRTTAPKEIHGVAQIAFGVDIFTLFMKR